MDEQWHLDKRIPIALIVTIMSGYAGGIWWLADLSNEVEIQGRNIERIEGEVEKRTIANTDANNRIIRIEEKVANQTEILQEIKRAVSSLRAVPQ